MILRAHQIGAIRKRLAGMERLERAAFQRVAKEAGISKRPAPDAHQANVSDFQIRGGHVKDKMLEPAITRPHHRELRKRALNPGGRDRKSTRLNSSHRTISYAVFCL